MPKTGTLCKKEREREREEIKDFIEFLGQSKNIKNWINNMICDAQEQNSDLLFLDLITHRASHPVVLNLNVAATDNNTGG